MQCTKKLREMNCFPPIQIPRNTYDVDCGCGCGCGCGYGCVHIMLKGWDVKDL